MAWLQRTTTCLAATLVLVAPIGPAESAPEPSVISSSVQPTDAARAAYEQAQTRVAALSAHSARLAASAEIADAAAERMRAAVTDDGGFVSAISGLFGSEPSDLDRAAEAADNAELARRFADQAAAALADAIDAAEAARLAWERAERKQEQVEAAWTADQAAEAAIQRSQFRSTYAVDDAGQDRLNHQAQRAWHRQVRAVARHAVVPPPARGLADPTALPAPLEPVHDTRNDLSPGVAEVDPPGLPPVTVLPAETVRAVSEAFHRVGLTDVTDPTTYRCGGLAAQSWTAVPLPADAAEQWEQLRAVPAGSAQPGDVVVLGSRSTGIDGTGVYVGDGRLVLADPTTGVAAVRPLGTEVLGIRRPGVAAAEHQPAAPYGGRCGTEVGILDAGAPLSLPIAPGAYHLTAGFGTDGELWSSGEHTGLDFAAPRGTPVLAAGAGTVTVEHPDWAGNLVRIDHGGGVETWYAHLASTDLASGDLVDAGDPVGLVGARGTTTGPHLHLEVRIDGVPYDPAGVLAVPELPRPSYENGAMPDDSLCPATPDGAQLLRCDGAVAFRLLAADYAEALGTELCVTDSYRSRPGQVAVFEAKPHLAAVPGTSVHGVGLAVDLCGGIERFGTIEHEWLVEHGPARGWHHPSWAAAGGSRPEPWHFEYDGAEA